MTGFWLNGLFGDGLDGVDGLAGAGEGSAEDYVHGGFEFGVLGFGETAFEAVSFDSEGFVFEDLEEAA